MFWLCIKQGIQERGKKCGGPGKWGNVIFWGMLQTVSGMSSSILGNVLKHSGECRQPFWEMSSNNQKNIKEHAGAYRKNILRKVLKHTDKCTILYWILVVMNFYLFAEKPLLLNSISKQLYYYVVLRNSKLWPIFSKKK